MVKSWLSLCCLEVQHKYQQIFQPASLAAFWNFLDSLPVWATLTPTHPCTHTQTHTGTDTPLNWLWPCTYPNTRDSLSARQLFMNIYFWLLPTFWGPHFIWPQSLYIRSAHEMCTKWLLKMTASYNTVYPLCGRRNYFSSAEIAPRTLPPPPMLSYPLSLINFRWKEGERGKVENLEERFV